MQITFRIAAIILYSVMISFFFSLPALFVPHRSRTQNLNSLPRYAYVNHYRTCSTTIHFHHLYKRYYCHLMAATWTLSQLCQSNPPTPTVHQYHHLYPKYHCQFQRHDVDSRRFRISGWKSRSENTAKLVRVVNPRALDILSQSSFL